MIPLNNHTHYSLLRAYCKPAQLCKLAAKYNYEYLGLSDFDTLSGAVNFMASCMKNNIKSIIGTKVRIREYKGHITLYAKNLAGWQELVKLSFAQISDGSVSIEDIQKIKNCICVTGDINSSVATSIITNNSVYIAKNISQSLSFYVDVNFTHTIESQLNTLHSIFKNDLYVGIQKCTNIEIDLIVADALSNIANKLNIPQIALNNTFIQEDVELEELQILLCSNEKKTFSNIHAHVNSNDNAALYRFFSNNKFGLYGATEYTKYYSDEQLNNTKELALKVDHFSLLKNPECPDFTCPNGLSQKEHLLQLCRNGWKRLSSQIDSDRTQEYVDRIKYELDVINRVGIEGYFLIVQDYVNWARQQAMVGPARGSAAGSLTAYLLGITSVDPIKYDLMFTRFYNDGRNAPGKVSLPDIDVDFPVYFRENVINYIRDKYNKENVSQVFTLQEIQGRSAIREVLRIYAACPNDFIDDISKKLPQKAAITDKLEEDKETSIIRWTLNNEPELMKDWCELNDGKLSGEYAHYFDKAIKIEGTFKTYGKHASAVIISKEPIYNICPVVQDKSSNELLAAIEYESLEQMGLLKCDILGLNLLDKLEGINSILNTGKLNNICDIGEETDDV